MRFLYFIRYFKILIVAITVLSGCSNLGKASHHDFVEDALFSLSPFASLSLTPVPLSALHWKVEYDSGGTVSFNPDGSGDLILSPPEVVHSSQTYSALVILRDVENKPLSDYVVELSVTSVRQFRMPRPNDWEVFWFFANYQEGPRDTKRTNYFILKPRSGVELGTAFGIYGQNFLKTNPQPTLELGQRQNLKFVKKGSVFKVYRDDHLILDYEAMDERNALYLHPGTFGLYTEDALVRVHSFSYSPL